MDQSIIAAKLSQTSTNISVQEPDMTKFRAGNGSADSNNNNISTFNSTIEQHQCFESAFGKPLVACLQNVHFSYNRKEKLIQNLNINLISGQIYGLLGPSGCGKSTTLKLILGLLRPQKGEVLVYGSKPNTRQCPIPG